MSDDLSHLVWRKSSRSSGNGGNCVEIAVHGEKIAVRDSKDTSGPALLFTRGEWARFLSGTKEGQFGSG